MVEQNDISYVLRQRCATEFFAKLGKCGQETLQMLENACVTEAIIDLQCFNGGGILKTETKGWLMTLEMGDQALLSEI
jgi:hypothetical protein